MPTPTLPPTHTPRPYPMHFRSFVMPAASANPPRPNLHRASFGGAACAHGDAAHAAASGGEQRRVPAEQPFGGQGLRIVLRGIEHHFDNALDVAIRLNQDRKSTRLNSSH